MAKVPTKMIIGTSCWHNMDGLSYFVHVSSLTPSNLNVHIVRFSYKIIS